MEPIEHVKGDYLISTDPARLDLPFIHHFLSTEAYWCLGISFERVLRSVENSLNFGLYHQGRQIGFERVITDYSTIAYLGDVFIMEEYRGRGLSSWLMETVMSHPELQDFRRWILLTRSAHGLYKKYGFRNVSHPEFYMERHDPGVYRR